MVPLRPNPTALKGLLASTKAGPQFEEHEKTAATFLAACPATLSPNIVWREHHGGRKYPCVVPGYSGPLVTGENTFKAARRSSGAASSVLLSSIPRELRPAFVAPKGHLYIDVDIDRCFPVLLATLARDEVLLAASLGDLHQTAGDEMAPHLLPAERRRLGKLFNNSVVGGISPSGWHQKLKSMGHRFSLAQATAMHSAWWGRFERATLFRDRWSELHRAAAKANQPLRVELPTGRAFTFDKGFVRGQARREKWKNISDSERRLEAAMRTTFSSVFRGVESVILDRALQLIYPLRNRGLRLVLPLYDGALFQAPEADAETLANDVRQACLLALTQVGVPAGVSCETRAAWGEIRR